MQACLQMAEREKTRQRQVICSIEPRFKHISDAEAFTLTSEETPRV